MTRAPRMVLHVMNGAAGGAALSTLGLIREFEARGVQSAVACLDAGTAPERDMLRDATHGRAIFLPLYIWNRKIRADTWKRPLLELRQWAKTGAAAASSLAVARFLRRVGADLVHSNTVLTIEGATASRLCRVPHVVHLRELVGVGQPFRFPVEGRPFGAMLSYAAEAVIANSGYTAQLVRDWLPAGLLHVVPNGLDLAPFSRLPPPFAGPRRVSMIGSVSSRWKKHQLFIEAAAEVSDPDVEFRIYGHDPGPTDAYAAGLRKRIEELGLGHRFFFAGFRRPEEAVAETDILVHPADKESFGRIAVEAMAAGRPVIGVRAGGIGEVVVDGETGLLTQPDDPAQMGAAIRRLLSDRPLAKRLGVAGRERARQRYSVSSCASGVLAVYAEVLAG